MTADIPATPPAPLVHAARVVAAASGRILPAPAACASSEPWTSAHWFFIPYSVDDQGRVRSYASVPLTHDGAPVGALHMYRHEVRPFTEDELAALATFGEQASLAVVNARLFKDLGESLKLQRATSEVLQLISAHPGDLTAVRNGLIERAVRLCAADDGGVWRFDGDAATFVANPGHPDMVGSSIPVRAELRAVLGGGDAPPPAVTGPTDQPTAGTPCQTVVPNWRRTAAPVSVPDSPLTAVVRPWSGG